MGLDTSHDCWHGAYSAFGRWRKEIAKAAGLPPLELMEGFWGSPRAQYQSGLALTIRVAADTLERATYDFCPKEPGEDVRDRPHERLLRAFDFEPIRWDCLKPDPLHALLHHSDCDGEIAWELCSAIADRLEDLLPKLPKLPDGEGGRHFVNWRITTQKFIEGLRLASRNHENVDFH